jgi:hypothetical protein
MDENSFSQKKIPFYGKKVFLSCFCLARQPKTAIDHVFPSINNPIITFPIYSFFLQKIVTKTPLTRLAIHCKMKV